MGWDGIDGIDGLDWNGESRIEQIEGYWSQRQNLITSRRPVEQQACPPSQKQ